MAAYLLSPESIVMTGALVDYDQRVAGERGRAVLLVSSDFDEVEKVCHRALVFSRGKLTAEIDRKSVNVTNLTALAAGVSHEPETTT